MIINFCGRTRSRVLQFYFPGSNIAKRDGEGNVILEKEKVQDIVKNIYLNRIAFIFIALGYIGSIYGETAGQDREKILLSVIVGSAILNLFGYFVAIGLSKILYNKDWIIPYDEVEGKADTIITDKEVDGIFEE